MRNPSGVVPSEAIERAKHLFRYLMAFDQLGVPIKRRISDQPWSLRFADLPQDPCIAVGEVFLASPTDSSPKDSESGVDSPLLRVRRPKISKASAPPGSLVEWVQAGWEDPDGKVEVVRERNVVQRGQTVTVVFADDPLRVRALEEWQGRWEQWAQAERPVRSAMRVFQRLFDLKGKIELDSERVELMLGDGRLRVRRTAGDIDHPVLLQRVELVFDPSVPEFRLLDTESAPELYGAILHETENLPSDTYAKLRAELELAGYHPLSKEPTSGYLKRLVQQLSAEGRFREDSSSILPGPHPAISRDPVLYLRSRESGFAAAFARILESLDGGGSLPVSLTRLVGVEPPPPDREPPAPGSPWGEPPDVLLSKPANPEQVEIARALERHGAVLVQGPPGTGKSHTIANLIGHLVALGKRVLVTSHTTKALRVLREQIVDAIRPLSVAVLENDQRAREQMEDAVHHILSRLATSRESTLEKEVGQFAQERVELNDKINGLTKDLRTIREAEYLPILLAGVATQPSLASSWVADNSQGNQWIPGPVEPGVTMSLSLDEVTELYRMNGGITTAEEREILGGLPDTSLIPDRQSFNLLVTSLRPPEPHESATLWVRQASKEEIPALRTVAQLVADAARKLAAFAQWQRLVVAAGYGRGAEAIVWRSLNDLVRESVNRWEAATLVFQEYAPEVRGEYSPEETQSVLREIHVHVHGGGSLSGFALLLRPKWKALIQSSRINGEHPRTSAHFRALQIRVALDEGRKRLALRWTRQAEVSGLPSYESCGTTPEPVLLTYATQFEPLLSWWEQNWPTLTRAFEETGFKWLEFHSAAVATSGPAMPFDQDSALLAGPLLDAINSRLSHALSSEARGRLADLERLLEGHRDAVCTTLLSAIRERSVDKYEVARDALLDLAAKRGLWVRRTELLDKLKPVASEWAVAIGSRAGAHSSSIVPGPVRIAWRWRQLAQEIARRAELDERKLTFKLHQRRAELREVTTQLIDRLAWLGQLRRTTLAAQQALQGWAQIQRKIGKGTGKRVPALRAEARKLLSQARGAVPIWIMPLNRVADAFDPAHEQFDVVIVDEASQADPRGLLCWYLGKQIAVVGDHEQVSPLAVGQQVEPVQALINEHLGPIPNSQLYDGKTSIYDLAMTCFGGAIALREHFRCVPEIIEYSNQLSYRGEIRPLRNPASAQRPHVVEYVVDGTRTGMRNHVEARTIAALVKSMTELPEFAGKSLGAIALLGDEQAGLIQDTVVGLVRAEELERRRFIAGNSAQFQGDERDVMLLSMVDSPTGAILRMSQLDMSKQRYNVAASRARDQLWLVHSLDPARDLQTGDLRRGLIEHIRNPMARQRAIEATQRRAESPFETAVIGGLMRAGYRVVPQVWVGRYRIDMVVSDAHNQVALECDGDRHHGIDQIPADMSRQAILERAGWTFIRVRGTRFFRDQDGTLEWIIEELTRAGVRPSGAEGTEHSTDDAAAELRERVVRRAQEIMRECGWLAAVEQPPQPNESNASPS